MRRRGITLLELLVVMLILLMITAAAIPIVAPAMRNRQMRESTRMIFRMVGRNATEIPNRRAVFANLPDPTLGAGPGFSTGVLEAFLAQDATLGIFGEFYAPPTNHDFGWAAAEFELLP